MNKLGIIMALSLVPAAAMAQQDDNTDAQSLNNAETQQNTPAENTAGEDTILVRSTPTSQSMGTQILTKEQIARMPTQNGTITELLKHNPNVRFANTTDSSNTPGEIAPENVSFHGEKFYNNNFMIDGLSNNNTINPGANGGELSNDPDGFSPTDLPAGGTQSYWINSELVEQLEVFDSNVSAKYGDFTGGVVDARLKDPDLEKSSGKISYRTTRDAWTRYHIDEAIGEDFYSATKHTYQPKFKKEFYSFSANQPLSDKAGFIFAYNRQKSTIPFYQSALEEWDDQTRLAETYLLKGTYLADNGDIFRLTGMYSPHESKYFKTNAKNGSYTNTGGGYRTNIEWEHVADWGKMTSLAGYQFEENKIDHESDTYQTWRHYTTASNFVSNVITWGSANGNLGGYGSFATEKRTTTLKQDYELNPIKFMGLQHQLDLGWEVDLYSARYKRFRDVNLSRGTSTIDRNVVCQSGDDFCIDGEQYFKSVTLYPAREVTGNYTNYAVYLQDSMNFGNLEVTPGVRAQYDDFLGNLTLAPRFATSYDVFGDRTTRVFGGANRYYGQNLLAYKLRQGISSYNILTRTSATDAWTVGDTRTNAIDYDISSLKTPYSDELSLGLSQRIGDTLWTAKWVNRSGQDQFGRKTVTDADGGKSYVLDNNAKTRGDTFSLSAEPISPMQFGWADVSWSLGASIVKNKSSSQTYYEQSDTDENMVIFDGKLIEKGAMDALDFNTPWTAFVNVNTFFPAIRLNWNQNIGYTAGYSGYTTSTVSCPSEDGACGSYEGSATRYDKIKFKDYISYDWRFSYNQPVYKDQSVDLTLDVINVLDSVIETSQTTGANSKVVTYKAGRQFWLGVAYNW
ncbi:TonB-dependent siderophore receptor [Erwinia sp. Leaf53]|uniref:TonB-dependent receptor plug domain-containing protein n=1 Tax=Erwinia sp. Leaf53 TaxID=1736225 RepID=UPI0006F7DF0B|nr:TonB-dependent receptor plug domain-containing protein [Erwinia sp. Leaf53]KQN64764.1 TonB-dependent receptor [Erwinia sp. Leaf53]